jgi:hypothetical protein
VSARRRRQVAPFPHAEPQVRPQIAHACSLAEGGHAGPPLSRRCNRNHDRNDARGNDIDGIPPLQRKRAYIARTRDKGTRMTPPIVVRVPFMVLQRVPKIGDERQGFQT